MTRKMTLAPSDFTGGLVNTYENIAKKSGYPVTDNTIYDCRKLDVAANIQDAWICHYRRLARAQDPGAAEADIRQRVMAFLLDRGAKASAALSDNEVLVYHGFASEAA